MHTVVLGCILGTKFTDTDTDDNCGNLIQCILGGKFNVYLAANSMLHIFILGGKFTKALHVSMCIFMHVCMYICTKEDYHLIFHTQYIHVDMNASQRRAIRQRVVALSFMQRDSTFMRTMKRVFASTLTTMLTFGPSSQPPT